MKPAELLVVAIAGTVAVLCNVAWGLVVVLALFGAGYMVAERRRVVRERAEARRAARRRAAEERMTPAFTLLQGGKDAA